MRIIERKPYIERLVRLCGTPDIKIITGLRRAGKSELIKAYMDWIIANESNANIIYIDFADLKYDDLKSYKMLNDHCEKLYNADKSNVLIIDEIQLCNKFELTINSLYNSHRFDIYITGSNAFLLSSDLSTLFTGRYIEIPVYPFSFAEYCRYYDNQIFHNLFYLNCLGLFLAVFELVEQNHQVTQHQECSRSQYEYQHTV